MKGWFGAAPLLAVPVAVFNGLAFLSAGGLHGVGAPARLQQVLFTAPLHSGAGWPVTAGDAVVFASLVLLFIELLQSTSSRQAAIVNHSLSMVLFVLCLVEFLLWPAFAQSSFFLVTTMVLLDVLAGFIVTISAARRDIDVIR